MKKQAVNVDESIQKDSIQPGAREEVTLQPEAGACKNGDQEMNSNEDIIVQPESAGGVVPQPKVGTAEVSSPPRIARMCEEMGMRLGTI